MNRTENNITPEKAINVIETEIKCVNRCDCDKNCGNCDLAMGSDEILSAYQIAISAISQLYDIQNNSE